MFAAERREAAARRREFTKQADDFYTVVGAAGRSRFR